MLRSSRLVLLYGEAGSGKTQLLTRWLVPLLEQGDSEHVVYFDKWDGAPLAALNTRIERVMTPDVPAHADSPFQAGATWVEQLAAWTRPSGRSLRVIFDRFERFLAAPVDDATEEFEREWIAALAAPDLRVNFLVAMRSDAEPAMMARFQARIASFGDTRLSLPPWRRRRVVDEDVVATTASIEVPPTQVVAPPPTKAVSPPPSKPVAPSPPDTSAEGDERVHDEPPLYRERAFSSAAYARATARDEPVPTGAARARAFKRGRTARRVAVLAAGVLLLVAAGWFLRERVDDVPQARLPAAAPTPITPKPVGDAVRDEASTVAREVELVLAAADGVPHPIAIRTGLTTPLPPSAATPVLTIVRYDVLDAVRAGAAGKPDPRTATLRLLLPLHVDPLYFVVRKDDPLAYVHQIASARINMGAGGSDAAVGASHLYQRLFDAAPKSGQVSYLPDAGALEALLRERSVDVVIVAGRSGLNALFAQQRATPNAFKLLAVDRAHPASRRALLAYLPIEVPALESAPWLERKLPGLGVLSFLVAQARTDEIAGPVVRALCTHLLRLRQLGHPYWRDPGVGLLHVVGWRYAGPAESEMRACERRQAQPEEKPAASTPAKAADPASTVSRLYPSQEKR